MIINKIIKQQDLFIVPGHIENREQDILITDDYCGFDIKVGENDVFSGIESDGFVNILTLEEVLKYKNDIIENNEDVTCIILRDFTGDISVIVKDEQDVEHNDLDTGDYLLHQVEDAYDVYLKLPEGTFYGEEFSFKYIDNYLN